MVYLPISFPSNWNVNKDKFQTEQFMCWLIKQNSLALSLSLTVCFSAVTYMIPSVFSQCALLQVINLKLFVVTSFQSSSKWAKGKPAEDIGEDRFSFVSLLHLYPYLFSRFHSVNELAIELHQILYTISNVFEKEIELNASNLSENCHFKPERIRSHAFAVAHYILDLAEHSPLNRIRVPFNRICARALLISQFSFIYSHRRNNLRTVCLFYHQNFCIYKYVFENGP